jgi:glycerol-3-phosphate acyltransferase PlsX
MGGDFAPVNEVVGALQALRESPRACEVILIGDEQLIRQELAKHDTQGLSFSVVHAEQRITMDDAPTSVLRQKRNSSLAIAMQLQIDGAADAAISAGNTGAVLSASTLMLGRVKGISRPTIGTFFPSERGLVLITDAGANVDCKPQQLLEFGIMGRIYVREILKIANPTVGLLNIGEEKSKGGELELEAHKLMEAADINFIGNIEGRDILKGDTNVIVCDGYTGNVILKFGESVPAFLKSQLRAYADRGILQKLQVLMIRKPLKQALKGMDYEEYGGVPVLGVNGVSIIGHGKSSPKAIKNMIFRALDAAGGRIDKVIEEAMASYKSKTPQ